MDVEQVARLAEMIRDTYSPTALDPGVAEPTFVIRDHGTVLVVPRDQQEEPLRSMNLLGAEAVGPVLVVTFSWDDGDDGTVFVMPLDARDVDIDLDRTDHALVDYWLLRHMEWGRLAPRPVWEPETVLLSPRLALVHPFTARRD